MVVPQIQELVQGVNASQIATVGLMAHVGTQTKNADNVPNVIRSQPHSETEWMAAQGTCAMQTPDGVGPGN